MKLWAKPEILPENRWGVGERKMFALHDERIWMRIVFYWGLTFLPIGVIAGFFQWYGVEFYHSGVFNLLSLLTPGMRIHTPGAYNESIAAALWVYGTYTTPIVAWLAMRQVQNFRIPKWKSDRRNIWIICVMLLFVTQYVVQSKIFVVFNVPALGYSTRLPGRLYRDFLIGTFVIPPLHFLVVYTGITLSALNIRAVWRRRNVA